MADIYEIIASVTIAASIGKWVWDIEKGNYQRYIDSFSIPIRSGIPRKELDRGGVEYVVNNYKREYLLMQGGLREPEVQEILRNGPPQQLEGPDKFL